MTTPNTTLAAKQIAIKAGEHASAAGDYGHASAAGDYGHAAALGYRGHALAMGYRGHAAAVGEGGHASAAGYGGIAASLGGGHATAADTGAIVLTHWGYVSNKWGLLGVFAGMVGQTYGGVTIEPGRPYRLNADGSIEAVEGSCLT